jgi:hypothetical protein
MDDPLMGTGFACKDDFHIETNEDFLMRQKSQLRYENNSIQRFFVTQNRRFFQADI